MGSPLHVIHYDLQGPEAFDEFQDDHVAAVAPHGLAKEIQELLITRGQMRGVMEWGVLNKDAALKQILRDLDALYKACATKYREDL